MIEADGWIVGKEVESLPGTAVHFSAIYPIMRISAPTVERMTCVVLKFVFFLHQHLCPIIVA